ncbi:MAG: DUF3788 domain-containing protein, partial [Bacteroidales bacterium]|nr:DUF3788 domain-containing protein [Bacteroidales bacterium]
MEKPILKDKDEYPSNDVLSRYLGTSKEAWDAFFDFLTETYPAFSGEWRYYTDGKSWLYKVTKKKKTVCWVSVFDAKFKTTFYFPDRAEPLIVQSRLKKEYKEQFIQGKRYGKIRGITVS